MQLDESEKRLHDSQSKLARLRSRNSALSSKNSLRNGTETVKVERRSASPVDDDDRSSRSRLHSKTELLIPSVNPKISQPVKSTGSAMKAPYSSSAQASPLKVKGERSYRKSPEPEAEGQDRGTKRKFGSILTL